jgi:hypothetical protein
MRLACLIFCILLAAAADVDAAGSRIRLNGPDAAIEFVSGGTTLVNGPAAGELSLNSELRVGASGTPVEATLLELQENLALATTRLADLNARISDLENPAVANDCSQATVDGVRSSSSGGPDVYCDVTHKGQGRP